ncbi:MAG: hypothetical protein HYT87_19600 [Nitrospirae bacterium]|nr:hypothetical protein [Nitrospirota bacterium]
MPAPKTRAKARAYQGGSKRARGKRIVLTSFLTGLILAACALLGRNRPAPMPFRVWPGPPDSPRIELVMSFSSPDDLGFPRGFWSRVAQILFGSGPPRMLRPYAIAVRGQTVAITDTKLGAVHLYRFDKKDYRQIGRGSGGLISPVGLAIDRQGRVWVSDSVLAEVRIYRPDGKLEKKIHPFNRPTGLTYDEEHGAIWVADVARHSLVKLDENGEFLGQVGERGGQPVPAETYSISTRFELLPESSPRPSSSQGKVAPIPNGMKAQSEGLHFNFPAHLSYRSGRLFVTDTLNFRIQVLDTEGHPVSRFGRHGNGSGDFAMPKGVGVDSEGHVYVVDSMFGAFQIFDAQGNLLLGVGATGQAPGDFWLPSGLFADEQDRIWVADSFNQRVQVFQYLREGRAPRGPVSSRAQYDWLFGIREAFAVPNISTTLHNLSTSGTSTFKSGTINEVCVFCHTPHNSQQKRPLWNRSDPGGPYTLYSSSTLNATLGQPSGSSKNCFSCHDGTIALGSLTNSPTGQVNDLTASFLSGRALLGTGLTDDHPVSFTYDAALAAADPELKDPATLTGVILENNQVQCASCHEPHDNTNAPFLRVSTNNGDLCTRCHVKVDWSTSSHSTSAAIWNGLGTDPWAERKAAWRQTTVSGNSCMNCHDPHNAANPTRLLKQAGDEENTCYPCHNANVAVKNVQGDFGKTYRHPVATYSGVHNPTEDPLTMATHVECTDCHNPHVVSNASSFAASPYGAPLGVGSRLQKIKGVDTNGANVNPSTYLYEVCYKCHGLSNAHTSNFTNVVRRDATYNLRLKFDTANPSFHPVEAVGKNANVPSLLAPYTTGSIISCIDCHNSDASPWVGGAGANGPHGSTWGPGLFIQNYKMIDDVSNVWPDFDMCLRCHSQASLNAGTSTPKHGHILGCQKAPCMNCHDPHGSTVSNHLINFLKVDRFGNVVVQKGTLAGCDPYPEPTFVDLGTYTGQCYLKCHGTNHCSKSY